MIGRRIEFYKLSDIKPGDYWKMDDVWYCNPPWDHSFGCLAKHNVIEHEDGTITVSPSILITTKVGEETKSWHGYLEKGIWREV